MPSISSPEAIIVDAITSKLAAVIDNVLLGYSATGIDNGDQFPAILVQLDTLREINRQGSKARYQFSFIISVALKTQAETTLELLQYARQVREVFPLNEKLCPASIKHSLSETEFDIAPGHSQLSFADITLTVEAIL
ncbi:hypothetical protein [Endozoicomonas sp. Mp262]|uniref:hypothetical protein n=1 Tax=Endozoicomonas sp. Mp262 TaxID=2919499 RepID=UPI0021D82820